MKNAGIWLATIVISSMAGLVKISAPEKPINAGVPKEKPLAFYGASPEGKPPHTIASSELRGKSVSYGASPKGKPPHTIASSELRGKSVSYGASKKVAQPEPQRIPTSRDLRGKHGASKTKVQKMKVTAYCPCRKCCEGFSLFKRTATGKSAYTLGVAADPNLLAFGTKLLIPGVGKRVVDDTGGAMRQDAKRGVYHIDVRMKTHRTAARFGIKWLDVQILN